MNKNRETTILIVLLSIIILYVFYSFLLAPKIEANDKLKEEIEKEELQVKSMYAKAAGYSANVKKLGEYKDTLKMQADQFYTPEFKQEDFINLLHEYLNTEKLQLVSISSSDYANTMVNEYPDIETPYMAYVEENSKTNFSSKMLEGDTKYPRLDQMEIVFKYFGTYEEVQSFFDALKDTEKLTLCNQLSINLVYAEKDEEDEENARDNGFGLRNDEQENEEETESPESQIQFTVIFDRLYNLVALEVEPEKLDEEEVVMPENLADGSYRKMYTPENFIRAVKGIFSSDD